MYDHEILMWLRFDLFVGLRKIMIFFWKRTAFFLLFSPPMFYCWCACVRASVCCALAKYQKNVIYSFYYYYFECTKIHFYEVAFCVLLVRRLNTPTSSYMFSITARSTTEYLFYSLSMCMRRKERKKKHTRIVVWKFKWNLHQWKFLLIRPLNENNPD